jgi:hypothetical protein
VGTSREGIPYTRAGGTEAITVFEFIEDDDSNMLYGLPVYMYRFPNVSSNAFGILGKYILLVPHNLLFHTPDDGS